MPNPLLDLLSPQNRTRPDLPAYDPIGLEGLQDERKGELEDRQAGAAGALGASAAASDPRVRAQGPAYQGDLDRISSLLKPLNDDMASSPLNPLRAQQRDIEDANSKALLAGFLGGKTGDTGEPMTPAAQQADYNRRLEVTRVNSPVAAAQAAHEHDIPVANINKEATIGAAHEREIGYAGRTAAQLAKDNADNAARIQTALIGANRAVDAAAVGRVISENSRLRENLDRGLVSLDDPQVMNHLQDLENQLKQYSNVSGAGPVNAPPNTTDGHARLLMQKNPGRSADEYLTQVEAEEGGFSRPEDKEGLRQALIRAGAH